MGRKESNQTNKQKHFNIYEHDFKFHAHAVKLGLKKSFIILGPECGSTLNLRDRSHKNKLKFLITTDSYFLKFVLVMIEDDRFL